MAHCKLNWQLKIYFHTNIYFEGRFGVPELRNRVTKLSYAKMTSHFELLTRKFL